MLKFLRLQNWSTHRATPTAHWSVTRDRLLEQAAGCARDADFSAAEQYLSRALEEAVQRGAPPTERIELLLALVEIQRQKAAPELERSPEAPVEQRRALLAAAERSVRSAIQMATALPEPGEFVRCLIALGDVFEDAHDFEALEKVEREALRMAAALPHPDLACLAARTHRLGAALRHLGRHEEATRYLERSLDLHQKRYGSGALELAGVLVDSAAVFRAQNNHLRAKESLQQVLRIYEASKGPDAPETFETVQQLAALLEESGDLDGAAFQYERALQMKMRKLGAGNLEAVAEMQYHLASLHINWGNLGRARELLEECIGEFRRHGGPRYAIALERLAQLEESLGHYNAAVEELEKASRAWEKCGPARLRELIRNLDYRADLLEQLRRTKDAAWLRQRISELQGATPVQA